ncbi:MAG: hypothetical protein WCX17_02945 [Parcubacteria group bacterium]
MSKFFAICLTVVLFLAILGVEAKANQCEKKVIYISSANHDRDEKDEFGISRFEAMKLIIENSYDVKVIRTHKKVSAHNRLYVQGPGYSDETTLSRDRMAAIGKKIAKDEELTCDDLCVDQNDVIRRAYESGRCQQKETKIEEFEREEIVKEERVYRRQENINVNVYVYVQAPPPPPIPAPVIYVRRMPVYPQAVVVYDDCPGCYSYRSGVRIWNDSGYRYQRGWGPRYHNSSRRDYRR